MTRTVLLNDDDEHEREILARSRAFVRGGVLEASNGEEGLCLARAQPPSLILLDISMPVLDGWGTIQRLKADPLTAHHLERERLDRELEEVEHCIGRLTRVEAERPVRSRQEAPASLATGVDVLLGRGG